MKKIIKGLITVSLSTSLLVGCGSNEEKTTTTTTQEKSPQTKQKEQPPVPQEVLKQVKNLKQVGSEPVVSKEVERNSSSGVAARNGYVYYMWGIASISEKNNAKQKISCPDGQLIYIKFENGSQKLLFLLC